jgi:drug/metabolite transporter (DMT)-like permease
LKDYDSVDSASIRMWVATLTLLPVTALFIGFDTSGANWQGFSAILWASLTGTFGGFFLQLYTINRFGVIPASMVTYVIPLVSGIGGFLLLGERITPLMILGIFVILIGITLVQQFRSVPLARA